MDIRSHTPPTRYHGIGCSSAQAVGGFNVNFSGDHLCIIADDGASMRLTRSQWAKLVDTGNRMLNTPAAAPLPTPGGWSEGDDTRLWTLWAAGSSMDAMIDSLDRNSLQIERRLFRLGIIESRRELLRR